MRTRLLAVLLALASAGCGTSGGTASVASTSTASSPPASPPTAAGTLAASEWRLVEFERGGSTTRVALPYALYFDERDRFSANVCNSVSGDATHGDGWVELGPSVTTQMRCHGEGAAVESAFHAVAKGRVETEVKEPQLWLRGADGTTTLRYERLSGTFPYEGAYTVASGSHGGVEYRVLVTFAGDVAQSVVAQTRPGRGHAWGTSETAAPDEGAAAFSEIVALDIAGDVLVAGLLPHATVRVTHRATPASSDVELEVDDVPDTPWQAFAGVVDSHTPESRFVAYDRDGREVR